MCMENQRFDSGTGRRANRRRSRDPFTIYGTVLLVVLVSQPAALPALVHCTHGKDRTGVAVAMCLHICGASLEQIAADYSASHEWGCSVEGRAAMDKILPPHLAGRVNIDPW